MRTTQSVVGVDIGSSKICAVAAAVAKDGGLRVISTVNSPSRGILKGAVVDLEDASHSVGRVLDQLQDSIHDKISHVVLGTSATVASLNNRGTAGPFTGDRPFSTDDLRTAVHLAADAGLPAGRQALHVIPRRFIVDGQTDADNPVGLFGRRLDAEAHVVTIAGSTVRALVATIERWGAAVDEVVAEPLAAAQAVLSSNERELGIAIADIGDAATSFSVFVDGDPWHTATIPMGGRHITNDLAVVLGLPLEVAEDIKLTAGQANALAIDEEDVIALPVAMSEGTDQISRRYCCAIIEARVLEILEAIEEEVRRSGFSGLLPGGLVLTGGTAQLPGLARVASEVMRLRARVGHPLRSVDTSSVALAAPSSASAVGLLLWHQQNESRRWWRYPDRMERTAQDERGKSWRQLVKTFLQPKGKGQLEDY